MSHFLLLEAEAERVLRLLPRILKPRAASLTFINAPRPLSIQCLHPNSQQRRRQERHDGREAVKRPLKMTSKQHPFPILEVLSVLCTKKRGKFLRVTDPQWQKAHPLKEIGPEREREREERCAREAPIVLKSLSDKTD